MKKFVYSLLLFSVFFLLFHFLIYFTLKREVKAYPNNYLDAIIDKHHLCDSVKGKRLFFVGGSNLAFGINSPEISSSLGLPVINLGLHAKLGLKFMINEIKDVARKGDIVVLSIEYFLSKDGDYRLKKHTSSLYPHCKEYFNFSIIEELRTHIYIHRKILDQFSVFAKKKGNRELEGKIYNRESFNENGDVIAHLNFPTQKEIGGKVKLDYVYWDGIQVLNDFSEFAKENDIVALFTFPSYSEEQFILNKESLKKLERDLRSDLKIKIISKPEDFLFNKKYLFDTVYHLNKEGREIRTKKMIELLKKIINNNLL